MIWSVGISLTNWLVMVWLVLSSSMAVFIAEAPSISGCTHPQFFDITCLGILKGVVSLNGGTLNLHPKCWSFLVGKTPWLLGKATIGRKPPKWSNLRFGSCQRDAGTLRSTRWPADRLVPGAGAGSRWGWINWKDLEEIHGNPIRINQFSRLGGFKSWYFHPENWGRWTHFDQYFSKGLVQPPTRFT